MPTWSTSNQQRYMQNKRKGWKNLLHAKKKQKWTNINGLKGDIGANIMITEYFNTPVPSVGRSAKQKSTAEIKELIYISTKWIYLITAERFILKFHNTRDFHVCMELSLVWILCYAINRFQEINKKIETRPCAFSDYNSIKLEINTFRNPRKHENRLRLNNMFLNSGS